ncbi:MAG: sigma-54-dependent transcriptional regulator [Parvibaculales bacterium]
MTADVLIVDDEKDIRDLVAGILQDDGYATRTAENSTEALDEIAKRCPSLVVLDIWLKNSEMDGLEILSELQSRFPELPVIMISGHGNIDTAVSAIKIGAYDYIEKPFNSDRLLLVVKRAMETFSLRRENSELQRKTWQFDLIGNTPIIEKLRLTIEKTAPTNSRVFITGPAGSGKELVARMIHRQSTRAAQPFVAVNAAILEPENMEYVLFGQVENGDVYPGLLEKAHGGSLYIDEIGEMPIDTQNKILRVLTDQEFIRLGGGPNVKVDVRIITGSSQNMDTLISEGLFREDLYHRLNVVPISVPSLSERREDIKLLINYFVDYLTETSGLLPKEISKEVRTVLETHDWPGNVRQLRNCIEYILISAADSQSEVITMEMLPSDIISGTKLPIEKSNTNLMTLPLRDAREVFEREYLLAQISRFGGNISRTAQFVGMERSALHRKLKTLGVNSGKRVSTA